MSDCLGLESNLARPGIDAEGWAAAVSLLNDTVGSAESLAEIVPNTVNIYRLSLCLSLSLSVPLSVSLCVSLSLLLSLPVSRCASLCVYVLDMYSPEQVPEMEALCAHCRESWLAANRPAATQVCTVYEVVHWVPGDQHCCSEAPVWHVSAESSKAGVAASSTGNGESVRVAQSLESIAAGGEQNEWEWRGSWEIASVAAAAEDGEGTVGGECGHWEWETAPLPAPSLTSSMGADDSWAAAPPLPTGDSLSLSLSLSLARSRLL